MYIFNSDICSPAFSNEKMMEKFVSFEQKKEKNEERKTEDSKKLIYSESSDGSSAFKLNITTSNQSRVNFLLKLI